MLEHLSVRNYVLIDHLDITFGAKADRETVRQGEESAEIAGIFSSLGPRVLAWAEEHGIAIEDGSIIIRRLIRVTGRSAYTVNGSPITVKEGEELGHLLFDVSSQHAHQSLLRPDVLRSMLDEAAKVEGLLSSYQSSYRSVRSLEKEADDLRESIRRSSEEADYMRFSLSELDAADLKVGEEEELKAEIEVMNSAEFLRESLSSIVSEMKGASSSLSSAMEMLGKAARKDQRLSAYSDRLESLAIESDDILLSLRDHLSSIDFPESEMEEKNARLMQLQRIRRKFGGSIEEAIRRRDDFRVRLEEAENGSSLLESLALRLEKERDKMRDAAEELHSARIRAASVLSKRIEGKLKMLGMASAVFSIRVERLDTPGPDGMDRIMFLVAPNKGEKLSPVQDSASGGELSRIMLAVKVSMRSADSSAAMLFDEIDAGIGGTVANAVGEEMKALSLSEQVIAITHLPQIASRATSHFLVEKEERGGRTMTRIRAVSGEERVKEIARLLSGETSDLSLSHARALLEVQGK